MLGRSEESATVDRFLGRLAEEGGGDRALLITGDAGMGKTLLWDDGRRRAADRGFRVLTARCVEPESTLGFAGLADLLDGVGLDDLDRAEPLPAPQRHALDVALLRAEAGAEPADPRSVATAVLGVLRRLAVAGPVLLAVDDLPWLDASTRRVLDFTLRRIEGDRVGLLATARTDEAEGARLAIANLPAARRPVVSPAPLGIGPLRELLVERLEFSAPPRLLARIHDASGGNPYFALELGRQFAATPATAAAELAVPESLRRLVSRRMAGLPESIRAVLLAAALEPGVAPGVVIAAAEDPPAAGGELDRAAASGVVDVRHDRVTFTHPLLRSVLIDDARPGALRAVHSRLAAVVSSPSSAARHRALAAAGPDPAVADALDDAARLAAVRGAPETAAELADLALRMTPAADAGAAARRTLATAAFRFDGGDPVTARVLVEELVEAERPGPARAPLLLLLAGYQRYSGFPLDEWHTTLKTALAECAETDVPLRMAIHFALGFVAYNGGDPDDGRDQVSAVLRLAEGLEGHDIDARVAVGLAYVRWTAGERLPREFVERALVPLPEGIRLPMEERPAYTGAVMLAHVGEVGRARDVLRRERAAALERGEETGLPILAWLLARIEIWVGDWTAAESYAEEGIRVAELAENPFGVGVGRATRAGLRVLQGRFDEARADAAAGLELHRRLGLQLPGDLGREALGLCALIAGDAAGALAVVGGDTDAALRSGFLQPGIRRTLPLEIEALVRAGRPEEAGHLLARLLDSWQPDQGSWADVALGRCVALHAAADGRLPDAEVTITATVAASAALGLPFEQGTTLLVAGEIQRRARRRRLARESLTAAQEIFDGLGARPWSARCGAELARIAGRAPNSIVPSTLLTDAEEQVARLAAEGRTTREIAQATFTGVRTVEAHLHSAYQKLGVHSRVELSRVLGDRLR